MGAPPPPPQWVRETACEAESPTRLVSTYTVRRRPETSSAHEAGESGPEDVGDLADLGPPVDQADRPHHQSFASTALAIAASPFSTLSSRTSSPWTAVSVAWNLAPRSRIASRLAFT